MAGIPIAGQHTGKTRRSKMLSAFGGYLATFFSQISDERGTLTRMKYLGWVGSLLFLLLRACALRD